MLTIQELRDYFKADQRANELSLQEYKEAKAYYHGKQLSSKVLSELKRRGQPPLHENLFKMIVDKIMGYKAQNIQEVRIVGRQEQDKNLANLLQDLVRVFSQQSNFDKEIMKRDLELMLGLSIIELWVEDKNGAMHINLETLPSNCLVIDKYSTDLNANDARRFHKKISIDLIQAREKFGERVVYDRRSNKEVRVTIIESWYLENGAWNRYIWQENNNSIIAYEVSPFKDGGHPFIIGKFHIDHNNRWYGMFRDIKPIQDSINFSENKLLNMMGSLKAFYEEDAVLDAQEFANNASLDNAIIKVRSGALSNKKIEFVTQNPNISALASRIAEMRNLLKIISGLNDEALATATNRQSGVAIAQRRDAALMGLALYVKRCDDMDRLMFERVLSLIENYFTKEQAFRIVDKKTGERYFSINQKDGQNKIKIGQFDLVLNTQAKMQGREERFAHWSELLKTIANIRPDIITDLLPLMLQDTDSPIVEDIKELLALKDEQAAKVQEAQAKEQELIQQIQLEDAQSAANEKEAKANKYNAQAEIINTQAQVLNKQMQGDKLDSVKINNSSRGLMIPGGNLAGVKDMIYDSVRK